MARRWNNALKKFEETAEVEVVAVSNAPIGREPSMPYTPRCAGAHRLEMIWQDAGPNPLGGHRIVKKNGGYALESPSLFMDGTWRFVQECWSRDLEDVRASARYLGITTL